MNKTLEQFREVIGRCRELFEHKTADYGTAWRILRPSSITDQLYIKAMRIRSIEEKGEQKVSDPVEAEFTGLVNYSILALVQLEISSDAPLELSLGEAVSLYNAQVEENLRLLQNKNHDYGEAWRDMRVSTFTDMLLMRLLRIRQIEESDGKTLASEGVESNIRDMINYSVFALIQLSEQQKSTTV